MESANLPTRLIIPQPFASKDGAAFTAITDGSDTTVGSVVNFKDGFPPAYATPASGGGKYVGRGDMNALGDLASRNQFLRMCGVINTFDSEFASKIGGYPKGAILKYVDGNYIYDVISLVENNLIDFTSVGVDNTNWRKLNIAIADDDPILLATTETGEIDTTQDITNVQMNVCSGVLPRSGMISCTMKLGEREIPTVSPSSFLIKLTLLYKSPTAEQSAAFTSKTLYENTNAQSAISTPVKLDAGTLFQVVLAVGGLKYDNITVTTKLI